MPTTPNRGWVYPSEGQNPYFATIETMFLAQDADVLAKQMVDAKGDLLVASAADTVTRLAVGTNGQVLTAASGQATGLQWATPALTGSGTAGQITYWTGTGAISADTGLTWDSTANDLGIVQGRLLISSANVAGVDAKIALFLDRTYDTVGDSQEIVWGGGTGITNPKSAALKGFASAGGEYAFGFNLQTGAVDGYANEVVRMQGNAAPSLGVYGPTVTAGPALLSVRSRRGSAASPSAVLSGDVVSGLGLGGYHAGGAYADPVKLYGYANENWTNTAQGAALRIDVTPTGSTTPAYGFWLDQTGLYLKTLEGTGTRAMMAQADGLITRGSPLLVASLVADSSAITTAGTQAFNKVLTIPAGAMNVLGAVLKVEAKVLVTSGPSGGSFQCDLLMGSGRIGFHDGAVTASQTNIEHVQYGTVVTRATGASGTMMSGFGHGGAAYGPSYHETSTAFGTGAYAQDLTASMTITVNWLWGTVEAASSAKLVAFNAWITYPLSTVS